MTDKLIDVSERSANLYIDGGLLVIQSSGERVTIPPSEVAAVILSHPGITITGSALARLGTAGCVVMAADESRLPALVGLGVVGNTIQAERIRAQVEASRPAAKRLWQQIVRLKVLRQAKVLQITSGLDHGLVTLSASVRSGDPENVEAQAARRYWTALMGPGFTREHAWQGFNGGLDYAYAIVRAFIARSIVAAGLHPSLGLHHRNRYNPMCLADDLFEPFRPEVDLVVRASWTRRKDHLELDPTTKRELVAAVTRRRDCGGELRRLGDASQMLAVSLVRCFTGEDRSLRYPEMLQDDSGVDQC